MTDAHRPTLTAELLLDDLSEVERDRAKRVESVLGALAGAAVEADATATFPASHVATLSDAGLLGLVVPEAFGGLGGGLRDLAAATFAMGTVCPSTALAFFFHSRPRRGGCSRSRPSTRACSTTTSERWSSRSPARSSRRLGTDGRWMANFASESVKSSAANISISTAAVPAVRDGVTGWSLSGCEVVRLRDRRCRRLSRHGEVPGRRDR